MSDQLRRTVSAPKLQGLDRDDDKTRGSQRTTTEGKIDSSGWNFAIFLTFRIKSSLSYNEIHSVIGLENLRVF